MVGQPRRNFVKMASWSKASEHLVNSIEMSDQLKWNNQSDKYGKARLEDACKLALKHIHQPSYKNIKMILQSNQDMKDRSTTNNKHVSDTHAFVRGKDYYGGRNNE